MPVIKNVLHSISNIPMILLQNTFSLL